MLAKSIQLVLPHKTYSFDETTHFCDSFSRLYATEY